PRGEQSFSVSRGGGWRAGCPGASFRRGSTSGRRRRRVTRTACSRSTRGSWAPHQRERRPPREGWLQGHGVADDQARRRSLPRHCESPPRLRANPLAGGIEERLRGAPPPHPPPPKLAPAPPAPPRPPPAAPHPRPSAPPPPCP